MELPSSFLPNRLLLLLLLLLIFKIHRGFCQNPTLSKNVTMLEVGKPVRFVCSTEEFGIGDVMLWYLDGVQEEGSPLQSRTGGQGGGESWLTMVPERELTGRVLSCLLVKGQGGDSSAELLLNVSYPPSLVSITSAAVPCHRLVCDVLLSPDRTYDFACQCRDSVPACLLSWELTSHSDAPGDDDVTLVGEKTSAVHPSSRSGWSTTSEVSLQIGITRHAWTLTCSAWYPDNRTLFKEISLRIEVHPPKLDDAVWWEKLDWLSVSMYGGAGLGGLVVICICVCGVVRVRKCRRRRIRIGGDEAHPVSRPADSQSMHSMRSGEQSLRPTIRPVVSDQPNEPYGCMRSFPRDQLDLQELVGEGSFGLVYKAIAHGITSVGRAETVAVKTMKARTGSSDLKNFDKELMVCMSIGKHPNVITMLGFCTEEEPYLMIFEFASKGNLKSFLRQKMDFWMVAGTSGSPISSEDLLTFAYQVASGMGHLASLNIIHRDLAARNILLDDAMVCKLSDFGFARDVVQDDYYSMTSDEALPIRWMALESITENTYTTKSDVWSFGVFLWELVTMGSRPYSGVLVKDVITYIKKGKRLKKPPQCNDGLYNLMLKCWSHSETRRPDFDFLERTLRHMSKKASNYVQMWKFNPNHAMGEGSDRYGKRK